MIVTRLPTTQIGELNIQAHPSFWAFCCFFLLHGVIGNIYAFSIYMAYMQKDPSGQRPYMGSVFVGGNRSDVVVIAEFRRAHYLRQQQRVFMDIALTITK